MNRNRLHSLDGLRAVAILMVLFYHYLARFPDYYPYEIPKSTILELGRYGVHLFFVISGFVISLTLTRTQGLGEFAVRRISRLYPAMLLCSVLTFCFMNLVNSDFTMARRTGAEGFLPSLTFVDPVYWQAIGVPSALIDGAYWSLLVEVKFYVVVSIIYFLRRGASFFATFLFFCVLIYAGACVSQYFPESFGKLFRNLFITDYLYLFIIGVSFFEIFNRRNSVLASAAIAGSVVAGFKILPDIWAFLTVAICVGLFAAVVLGGWLVQLFGSRSLVSIGVASYTLYLLHQNIGVGLLVLMPKATPAPLMITVFIAIVAGLIGVSRLIYRFVEMPAQNLLRRRLRPNEVQAL